MPLDKKSIPLFLLLGCFCLSLLLTPRTNDDLAFQKSREIHDSATNIQQPENGMFAEYVQYTFENYAIVDTSWWLYQYTNVNTTHYNSSITYMHDNTTAVGHSWIVVRRSTGIIEDDYNYFGLNGTQDCMFIYNESTVSFVTGNRAVFSTPDLFQVNSTGFDPYYGSFVVAYGLTTAANEEVWYHTGSGLLIHGLQTLAPGNTSELWLTRSNMYYDMLYTPPFPSNDPWVRYDCGTWNTTSGETSAMFTEDLHIDRFGTGPGYNMTINIVAAFGPNGTLTSQSFNMTTSTIARFIDVDERGPAPYNNSGISMGLDMLYVDPNFMHAGGFSVMSLAPMGESTALLLPVSFLNQESFRGRTCWRVQTLMSTRVQATWFVDSITGLVLRAERYMGADSFFVVETVSGNFLNPGYYTPTPLPGSWHDFIGFTTENVNETTRRVPTSVHQQFTAITPTGFNVSETFIRGYNNDTSGQHEDWVMESKQGSAVVNIRTGELWNGSDPFMYLNTTFGYSGRFYQIPIGLYGDSYLIIPGGDPNLLGALVQVNAMSDLLDGVYCTRVQYITTFLTGNETTFLNGTVWFDNMYGLLHELIFKNETDVLVHLRKRNDAVTGPINNPQVQDSTFIHFGGYSLHNESGEWEYNTMTHDIRATKLDNARMRLDFNSWEVYNEKRNVTAYSGFMEVRNATGWVTSTDLPWYKAVGSPVHAFTSIFIDPKDVKPGAWIAVSFGPMPFVVAEFAGYDLVEGKTCVKLVPVYEIHGGLAGTLYYHNMTGIFMGFNFSTAQESSFMRTILENSSIGLMPNTIHDGAWINGDGLMQSTQDYYGNVTTSVSPISEQTRMYDNYNGSFNIMTSGIEGSLNLTSYYETIDQTTLRVTATTSLRNNPAYFNYSGYYGHTNYQLPISATLGSFVMMNVGPAMDVPFVVVGTGSHHGRATWILGLHGDYANAFGIMTNHTIFTEMQFYQDNRLFATLNQTNHQVEDYGYFDSMVSVNVLMSSFDAAPNAFVDNGYAEYKVSNFIDYTPTLVTAQGTEWWFTGLATYSGRFITIENKTIGSNTFMIANYVNFNANNESRYFTSISGINGSTFPDLNMTLMPDFMHVPTTLAIWDVIFINFPDSGPRIYKVVNYQLHTSWLGNRDAFILQSLDGAVNVAYDRLTGLLVSYHYQYFVNSTFKEVQWDITHSNILDPLETINLPFGNTTLSGFSIEYDSWGNLTHASSYQIIIDLLSNNGTESLVEEWFYADVTGWQRFTFRNNRLLWLDSIDPAMATYFYPNASGMASGFLSTCLFPTVNVGDFYCIQLGPTFEMMTVTGITSIQGIPAYELVDSSSLVHAYFQTSDGMLIYYVINNKTRPDGRLHYLEMWNEALYNPALEAYFMSNTTYYELGTTAGFYDASSYTGNGTITSFSWWAMGPYAPIGNGTGSSFNLFLPSTGITRVSLIVSTSEMEFSVFTLVINVTLYSPPPVANFTWVPQFNINVSTVVEFYDLSTDDGILVWWAWSFGDGYNSNDQNPVHQYLAPGTYTVLLSVYDNSSKQDYIQYNITVVNLVPVASFVWTPTIASTGEDVYFSDTSTDDEMAIVAWQWYFGDGTNSTLQHPVHVYMADGVFNVTLTVWDVHGANDSWSAIVTVSTNVAPTADFDWSPGTIDIDTTVTFNDLSVDSDGWIASWYWFFGDGADSYVQNATHKYNWPGTFTVTLSVWDNNGTSSLISKNLSVFNYAPEVTCLNGSIVSIMNGTSNNTLHFLLTDKESGTGMYSVYIDGSYVDANSFVNGSIIVVPIDGLLPGAHEVNMTNNDGYTFTSDIVFVQVNLPTNIPPVISCLNGTNVVIQGNTTGNLLFFQVHDEDNTTGFFLVEINGTPAGSGSWNNVTLTPIQIDGLDAGNWTVNFTATDGSNSTSFFVSVEVLANPNVPPVVECVFGPTFTFQNGTTSNYIQLVVTDTGSASGTFVAYIDNVACDSGPWINITAVNINLDFLSPGIYEFNLTASDGDLEGSVLVTVNVTSPPPNTPPSVASWDGLSIEFQNGTTGNVLRFVVTDAQSLSGLYTIDMNLSAYDSGSWDNDTFVYVNLDSLAPGTYQLNFTASDGELFGYVFVFVNVTSPPPNTPPTVTSLDGLSVEFQNGTNGNIFQFIVTDTQTGSGPFTVTINTSAYDAGTWTNDTALDVNLDSLSPGTYQLNFTASDGELFGYVFVFVNVTSPPPNTPPSIDCINGSSVTIEYGSIDNVLRFNVTDAQSSTGTYSVFIGITPWGSGSWTNASLVNVDIDGLLAGTHTLNFTANDTVLTSSMYVSITVNPPANMAPVVTVVNGTTIEFIEGTPSVYIGFIVQDDNDPSGNYEIRFSNETVYDIGTWTNNSLHLVLLGPSLSGTFAFNVIGFDSGGLNHTKVVTVTVLGTPSNTAPTVNISTPLITYQVGTKNHSVSFVVTDNENSTGTYTVRLANGSVIAGGTWINETVTNASVDGLPIGTHVIDIVVSDGVLEETLNFTVIVTPVPNAPPTAFFTYATPNPAITIVYAKIPITFTDGSTDPDGEEDIVEWFWDFGTNLTSNQKNPGSIAFPTNGTFTIRLTVVDSAGNNDTYEMEINVLPLPDEDIPGYAPGLVMFIAMAMIAGVIAGIKKKYNRA